MSRHPTVLAPSILSADFGRLAEEIRAVEEGGAEWIHVDVMDGHFVPNITLGPMITAAADDATDLPLDVHLMIESPERYVDDFVRAGADVLTVHAEACPHLHRVVQQIREAGAAPGVALNPATPLAAVEEIAHEIDLLLIMTVNPGFGGQAFIEHSYDRISRARQLLDRVGSQARLEIDGGASAGNAAALVRAGADTLVAGSAVYRHPDGPGAGVRAIRQALSMGHPA